MSRRVNWMLTIVPVPRSDVDMIVRLAISPTMIPRTTRFEQISRVSAGCWSLSGEQLTWWTVPETLKSNSGPSTLEQ